MKNWKTTLIGSSLLLTAVGGALTAYAATNSAATPAVLSAATDVQSGADVGPNVNVQQQVGSQVGGADPVGAEAKHAEGVAEATSATKPEAGEAATATGVKADVGPNVQVQQNFQGQQ